MMDIAVLVGNPKPASRTSTLGQELAREIGSLDATISVVDLADHAQRIFDWPDPVLDALTAEVASKDLLVIATPTYKAAYTGLLKAFLDRYPHRGLAGLFAVPVMTIASDVHALAPELSLRPLLVELGAMVPTTSLAFPMQSFDKRREVLLAWTELNKGPIDLIRGAVRLRREAESVASERRG